MKFCHLIVSSKSEQSLKKFKKLFFMGKKNSFNRIIYTINKKTKKQIVTILKSPHVNKTAQEQFEEKLFSTVFIVGTYSISTFIIFLKKLKSTLFMDTNIQLRFAVKKNFRVNAYKSIANMYNSSFNTQECNNKNVNFLSRYKSKTKLNDKINLHLLKINETVRKSIILLNS